MISILDPSEGSHGGPTLVERMHLAFSNDGKLAGSPQFEYRSQQQHMAELVAGALEKNRALIVEAATGVGKSLAYLLPAATFALEQKRKAIICTHTINLQEQLIHKDIPIVKKVVGDFHAELLKGRNNYLCPTRLKSAFSQTGDLFSSSEAAELQLIEEWHRENPTATLSEMDFTPGARLWSMVRSEPHACTPRRCPPGSGCVYQDVRRRMAAADMLVLNHTLFFTLMASAEETLADDANFIFPRDFVILDEAHTIENIAAQAFGIHVSESSVRFELGRLYNPKTRKGFFASVGDSDAIRDVVQAIAMTETFFRNAEAVCQFTGTYAKEFRIREPGLVENELALPLQRVANFALKAGDAAKSEGQRLELHDIAKRLGGLRTNLSAFLDQTEDGHVYWAERGTGDHRSLALHSAPIDVSPKLEEIFFGGGKACVFTSATLSVGDDERLNYFRKRVGGQKAQSACIHSPFDFKKQMRLYLVKRMPEPKDEAYGDAMQDKISHFLGLSQGRAFVLFTSYTQMTAMADRLEDFCLDHGWRLLVQGRGMPRHQLLAEFKKDVHSILFGTDSFWTGVDVPGEALSNVIITRLPFAVPDHPLTASRMEHLEEQGINSFSEYSVPEAILKLRQGVGRLIRTQKDQGMVVILDNRILSKPYGRAFLASLPDCPTEIVA
jgi:ATP-dependent DNA helicase DinG